jgi:hypothetical protein
MNKENKIDIELGIESLIFHIEQIINSPIKKRKSNIDIVLKTLLYKTKELQTKIINN